MSDEMDRNILEMPVNLITGLSLHQYRSTALSVLSERDALRAKNERIEYAIPDLNRIVSYWKGEADSLRAENERLRGALQELRLRLHAVGRRPEECYEMSVIDDALKG